jgi:hypothetical protein
MPYREIITVNITCQEESDKTGREEVIADAEAEIQSSQDRIRRLRASIRVFKERLQAGEPLPAGLESASTEN